LHPRKPIGTKKLKRNTKTTEATWAGRLLFGKLVDTASASMQVDIPAPLTMKSFRRPKRSIVKKATKEEHNFHVSMPPDRIRDVWLSSPRPCWKMTVLYTDIKFVL
jgi:hypothetical protein